MPILHSLSLDGLHEASSILARIRSGESSGVDRDFLSNPEWCVPSKHVLSDWEPRQFQSRWHLAGWLYGELHGIDTEMTTATWSWLALHMFDVVCPKFHAARKVREDARYILRAGDFRKSYRHLLAGPYLLYAAHKNSASSVRGLLATTPDAPGEVYEQLAARKFLVTSRAVVGAATRMYLDSDTLRLKKGAGGSGGGSPRRFSEVLQQLDLTYDLQVMNEKTLLGLLPKEFQRFLGVGTRAHQRGVE